MYNYRVHAYYLDASCLINFNNLVNFQHDFSALTPNHSTVRAYNTNLNCHLNSFVSLHNQ